MQLISDIVVRECKRHLSEGTETLVEEFHDKFDSLSWKRVSSIGKLSALPSYIDKEKITKGLHKLYDDYLKSTHAQIVNSDGVNLIAPHNFILLLVSATAYQATLLSLLSAWYGLSYSEKWEIENASHQWEISVGSTHTRIHLCVKKDEQGYWGNPPYQYCEGVS